MAGPIVNPTSQGSQSCIEIKFAGSGFKENLKLGAVPLVSINREYIKDGAGSFIGVNNKVTLNGKIYPSGSLLETNLLLDKERDLRNLFGKAVGDFYIYASGQPLLSGINAKILSYEVDKTSDNWTRSLDYVVNLEFYEATDSKQYRVSRVEENWSIEPLEDYLYVNTSEYTYTNYPQFRITRKLSAVGIPNSGYVSHFDKKRKDNSEYNFMNVSQVASGDAYMQARQWVNDRLELPFNHDTNSNAQYTTLASKSTVTSLFYNGYDNGLFLFNHNRSINYSITEGSFEVGDSWLAIPSNRKYTEEFTIETSTDNKNIRTTKIQGVVKGLGIAQTSLVKDSMKTPDGSGNLWLSQHNISGETYGTFLSEKYLNANSGWLYEVKPKLPQRAQTAISTRDRTQDYLPGSNGLLPPGNPVFRKERGLNPIPLSTSESHDPLNGTISYTYEYNNNFKIISGVVSESYKVSINGPADQFAETFVLARPIGPVLQALDTKTSTTKSVSIDLVLVPPTGIDGFSMDERTCPVWTGGYIFNQCEGFIEAQKPPSPNTNQVFKKTDVFSWSPTDGRYSRNVEWLFQPCNKNGDAYQIFY